jgi:hypothetical protein
MAAVLSTGTSRAANRQFNREIPFEKMCAPQSCNASSQFAPQSQTPMDTGQESKGMGMTELQHNAASEREEIAARVASFKATQERFRREREEYFVTTLENARHSENAHSLRQEPPFWS